jgi:hypothetical protein
MVLFSPVWVQDIIDLLEKLYSNPIFAESHPLPEDELVHLEDVVKVTRGVHIK